MRVEGAFGGARELEPGRKEGAHSGGRVDE